MNRFMVSACSLLILAPVNGSQSTPAIPLTTTSISLVGRLTTRDCWSRFSIVSTSGGASTAPIGTDGRMTLLLEDVTDTYHDSWMTLFVDFTVPLQRSAGFLYLSEDSGWRHIQLLRWSVENGSPR